MYETQYTIRKGLAKSCLQFKLIKIGQNQPRFLLCGVCLFIVEMTRGSCLSTYDQLTP